MTTMIPLPREVRDAFASCLDGAGQLTRAHPGLALDKYASSWDARGETQGLSERVQRPAVDQVARLSQKPPEGLDFDDLVKRWERVTNSTDAITFVGETTGPLTLHLARASALENAGICLHPIYGFTYLPGSGLKGLAHAFACEVWLPTQPDKQAAWNTICRVFGVAPSPWLKDLAKRLHVPNPKESRAGAVVFHDAWPTTWPKLNTDILNSHHREYYENGEPPGDWEDPVPVYFLSVSIGARFKFTVAPRRDESPGALQGASAAGAHGSDARLAADWLAGGLAFLGCGAKTATGYGAFRVERPLPTSAPSTWAQSEAKLELVTPAFLAGAEQQAADCVLRPSTLRGQLRWWWRTLHVGYVDVATLRRLEAAIWGDTETGGAVRITVTADGPAAPLPFERTKITADNRLPSPPDKKTTQGLTYHSYGMDENREGKRLQRFFVSPGAKWKVTLVARPGVLRAGKQSRGVPANLLLAQAQAALDLLCRFGGVGAKARKGFGSFADQPGFDLAALKRKAAEFRADCGLNTTKFNAADAQSPSLEQMLGPHEFPTEGVNHWLALDQLAAAAQQFAKKYKHQREKMALGLPRKIGRPVEGRFDVGRRVKKDRHASPVLYHFAKSNDGSLVARIVAFPSCELPNFAESKAFLGKLLGELKTSVPPRFKDHVAGAKAAAKAAPAAKRASATPTRVKIVAKREKGGYDVQEEGYPQGTLTLGTPPAGVLVEVGAEVDVQVHNDDSAKPQYKWPTAAPKKADPGPGKGKDTGKGRR